LSKKGSTRKLVCHENDCQWVNINDEEAIPGKGVDYKQKDVREAKPKRLDKLLTEELDGPTADELDRLKMKLQLISGCVFYKHGAIYLITCEGKKRRWKRLGRWQELRRDVISG
jgi:hypothetical protein